MSVCQLCFGKAKISFDFIQNVIACQKKIKESSFEKVETNRKLSTRRVEVQKNNKIELENAAAKVFEVKQEIDETQSIESSSSDEEVYAMEENDDESDNSNDELLKKTPAKKKTALKKSKEIFINTPVTFTCAMCKSIFPSFPKLSVHMKLRTCRPIDEFDCLLCKKRFPNNRALGKHKSTHKPKEILICDICGKEYRSQFDLDFHTEVVHNRISSPKKGITYRCSHCTETFNSHLALVDHIQQHKKEKHDSPRLCEICAKECPNLKSYRAHVSNHRAKKFLCDVCNKSFLRSVQLIQHMHVHTGVKSFACDICKRAFAKQDSLRSHKKREHQLE